MDLYFPRRMPLECPKSASQSAIDAKLAEIHELDHAIWNLQAALDTLYNRHAKLFAELEKLQSGLGPINRLPAELLVEIFVYFRPVLPNPGTTDSPSRMREKPPWRLALVCRSWREVAFGMGELWSVLDLGAVGYVNHTGPCMPVAQHEHDDIEFRVYTAEETLRDTEEFFLEAQLERAKECIVRSKFRGLAIRLWVSPTFATLGHLLLDLLLQYRERWQYFCIVTPPESLRHRLHKLDVHFPRLQTITYDFTPNWDTAPWRESFLSPLFTTNLTKLNILGDNSSQPEDLPVPWSALEHYNEVYWDLPRHQRFAIYSQFTNLVVLRVFAGSSQGVWDEPICFPNLRVATFAFRHILQGPHAYAVPLAFEMPALEEYSIEARNTGRFSHCIPRASKLLRRLSIAFVNTSYLPGEMEDLLEGFPSLEKLSLFGPDYLTDECVERLTPADGRRHLLPRLRTLRLDSLNFVPDSCRWTTLLGMIRGRFDYSPKEGAARLERFEFSDHRPDYDENVLRGLATLAKQTGWDIQVYSTYRQGCQPWPVTGQPIDWA